MSTSSPIRIPCPPAVGVLKARMTPQRVLDAVGLVDDAEREIGRLRPLKSDEDRQDMEMAIAAWSRADKVLSGSVLRPETETRSLS